MKNRYGKILTLIIVLMLAVMTLAACSSGSGDTEPVVTEEPPAEEELVQEEPPAEKGAEQEETDIDAVYKTGQVYVLKDALRVREEPSTDSRQKKRSELTEYSLPHRWSGNGWPEVPRQIWLPCRKRQPLPSRRGHRVLLPQGL